VAEKYGIRMCSGDTIGPGGIMRTLREFPKILEYCRQIETLCPDAWVINYINPTSANGIGLRLFAPKLKSFALCDGLHMPHVKRHFARRAGIIVDDKEWTADVIMEGNRIVGVITESKSGREVIMAKTVIDCTGDGDVAHKSGAEFVVGRATINASRLRLCSRLPGSMNHAQSIRAVSSRMCRFPKGKFRRSESPFCHFRPVMCCSIMPGFPGRSALT
jgi:hypothetical protein